MEFPADREIPDSQSDPGNPNIDLCSEFPDNQPTFEVFCNEASLTNLNTEVEDHHISNFDNNFQNNEGGPTESYTSAETEIVADSPPHTLRHRPRLVSSSTFVRFCSN